MNIIRSKRSEYVVSTDDKLIKLKDTEINKIIDTPLMQNVFGKIYWFEDDNIVWLAEDKYNKYKIVNIDIDYNDYISSTDESKCMDCGSDNIRTKSCHAICQVKRSGTCAV